MLSGRSAARRAARPRSTTWNLFLGRIKAKQRNVDMVRRPHLEHRRRDRPVRMRNIRVDEADRTVGGLDRHRDRHRRGAARHAGGEGATVPSIATHRLLAPPSPP